MSKTDNTRPYDVALNDKTVPKISQYDVAITGGINYGGGVAKVERKQASTSRRQHVRRILHGACLQLDRDSIDITPIRADKKTVGWRHDH